MGVIALDKPETYIPSTDFNSQYIDGEWEIIRQLKGEEDNKGMVFLARHVSYSHPD
jgi:hypothetical protein